MKRWSTLKTRIVAIVVIAVFVAVVLGLAFQSLEVFGLGVALLVSLVLRVGLEAINDGNKGTDPDDARGGLELCAQLRKLASKTPDDERDKLNEHIESIEKILNAIVREERE
jgi:hypothetical protein